MSTKQTVKAYQIERATMNGSECIKKVWLDEGAARIRLQEKADEKEEWVTYSLRIVNLRPLTDKEGEVEGFVVAIERESEDEVLKARALKKLTIADRRILGL